MIKLVFSKLLLVREIGSSDVVMPMLVGIRNDNGRDYVHWNACLGYAVWQPDDYIILHEYHGDDFDAAEQELSKYVPKPQEPSARLGWISPKGEWYPCGYGCHSHLETILANAYYGGSVTSLEKQGWISVKGGALIGVYNEGLSAISEDAKNTLRKVVEEFEMTESSNPEINWHQILLGNPEKYYEQQWMTGPTDSYCLAECTYAQELRRTYEVYFDDYQPESDHGLDSSMISKRLDSHPGD